MFPEFTEKRFRISFIIPISIAFCSALFTLGFWISLLILLLETFFFWALIVGFVEIFLNFNVTERKPKWKEMGFCANIAIVPLFLTGCLLPFIRNLRDSLFPSNSDWESMQKISGNLGYQILVILPNIIAIITVILIVILLAIAIYEVHEIEFLKSLIFALVVGILAFTISTVLAGLPFYTG